MCRRARTLRWAPTDDARRLCRSAAGHGAVDPVCGMTVDVATARYRSVHEGPTYYFCAAGCRDRFESDPARFESVGG
jgi:YHS domain-containing protein